MYFIGTLLFGFIMGFIFCAWMMGQKKQSQYNSGDIIDAEWTESTNKRQVDTWA